MFVVPNPHKIPGESGGNRNRRSHRYQHASYARTATCPVQIAAALQESPRQDRKAGRQRRRRRGNGFDRYKYSFILNRRGIQATANVRKLPLLGKRVKTIYDLYKILQRVFMYKRLSNLARPARRNGGRVGTPLRRGTVPRFYVIFRSTPLDHRP